MGPKKNIQREDTVGTEEAEVNKEVEQLREDLHVSQSENIKVKSAFSGLECENRRLDMMLQENRDDADTEIAALQRKLCEQSERMEREREVTVREMRVEIDKTRSELEAERRSVSEAERRRLAWKKNDIGMNNGVKNV